MCVCVCVWVGGFLVWVCLSTLILYDGTQCVFINYSCRAEGATLGKHFDKSMSELFIMAIGYYGSAGGVAIYQH